MKNHLMDRINLTLSFQTNQTPKNLVDLIIAPASKIIRFHELWNVGSTEETEMVMPGVKN